VRLTAVNYLVLRCTVFSIYANIFYYLQLGTFAGSDPAEIDEFMRAIEIHNTTYFGQEYSRQPHVIRFHGMLKIPSSMTEILLGKIYR
jgi:hypothetical protein